MNSSKKLKDLILQKETEGKIVFMTAEGPHEADLEQFINQPTEGLLYDLNRDRCTVLAFIDDPNMKWVNDFAVNLVITKLKGENEKLRVAARLIHQRSQAQSGSKEMGDIDAYCKNLDLKVWEWT